MRAEQFTDIVTEHGEGPVWLPERGLHCVDMEAGDLLRIGDDGTLLDRVDIGRIAAVIRPRTDGGLLVAAERHLVLFDADGTRTDLPEVFADAGIRFNEGGCDPDGTFYCGTMAYAKTPGRARLFRFDDAAQPHTVVHDATISNGFWFSPDGSRAYYNDTPTQHVDVFDWSPDTGLTDRRHFVAIDPDDGAPDGLTVDAEGGVWVACWGGSAVRRFTPDGRLDTVIEVPAKQVSSCTLGGAAGDTLYITTSREGLSDDEAGLAGALFVVEHAAPAQPVLPTRL
ncbi:MAG: SMP-30/gluconolactonase/LRE family protein [Jatrophihabitans sp.]|uniref:SMP-30/gluconolactonase/LRE family protein n=1 Tax=Jatrophihabitans sp. TaxID=1932789 RepID=UPI003F7D983E